jgi:uncharacterized protein (DUF302 family)
VRSAFVAVLVALMSFNSASAPRAGGADTVTVPSKHSVSVTIDKLEAALKAKGVGVVARIDHAAGAKKVGMELKPTQLLVFGNPKLGTPLMQADRTIGLDLPMKVLAWEDDQGKTWVAYTKPSALKARYAIGDRDKVFGTMAGALGNFVKAATE